MNKPSLIGAGIVLVACAAVAAPRSAMLTIAPTTNDYGTATETTVSGYIDEIVLEAPTGVTSGGVAVVATQVLGNTVTLADKSVTADIVVRLGVDYTDTAGTALTGDPPRRYLSYGDSIAMTLSNALPTGLTWRVWIKYDNGK